MAAGVRDVRPKFCAPKMLGDSVTAFRGGCRQRCFHLSASLRSSVMEANIDIDIGSPFPRGRFSLEKSRRGTDTRSDQRPAMDTRRRLGDTRGCATNTRCGRRRARSELCALDVSSLRAARENGALSPGAVDVAKCCMPGGLWFRW